MPEEMNAFEGPLEGGPLANPLGGQQRVDVDGQTNIESSLFAEKTKASITQVETNLGGQIAETDEQLKSTTEELTSKLKDGDRENAESIANVGKAAEQQFSELAKAIGLSPNEEAPEEVISAILMFTERQNWAVAVIKDENSSEEDLYTAKQIYKQWGETFTVGGFIKYMMNPEVMKLGTLSTEQYKEYEEAINEMIAEKDSKEEKKSDIESGAGEEGLSEEDKAKVSKLKSEIAILNETIRRYTDVHPQTGLRITDFDGGSQYWTDKSNESDAEYRTDLALNVIGNSDKKDHYRKLEEGFKAAADDAQTILADIEAADEAGEEISEDLKLQGDAAEFMRESFGFVSNVIAVYAFAQYNRTFKIADFSKEAYSEYGEEFENRKSNAEQLEEMIADLESQEEPDEAKIAEVKAKLSKEMGWFEDYACMDDVQNDYIKCNSGYVLWQITEDSDKLERIITDIQDNVIGYVNAGEYFEKLKSNFKAAADDAQTILTDIEAAKESGEPVSEDMKAQGMAANWFVQKFGVIENLTAVSMFNEHTDDFLMANFTAEVYAEYGEELENRKSNAEQLEEMISDLESQEEPDEAKIAEVKAKLSIEMKWFESYACIDEVQNDYIKCESGFVAYEKERHNVDEKAFREENTEVIGLNPSTSVDDSKSLQDRFESEANDAQLILESEESTPEEREEAEKFKARFGFKVSTVALASYELYLRELDISNSLGVIVRDITETTNGLIDNIESTVKNTKLVNADVYPLPNGSVNTFEVNYLESGSFDVASVALNGVVQKEGIHYGTDGKTINFLGIPALGTTITVVLHVETSIDLSEVRIDVLENLPSKLMAGESYCINNGIKASKIKSTMDDLVVEQVETAKLKADSTKATVDLTELQVKLKDKVSQLDKDIADAEQKKTEVESSLADAKSEQKDAQSEVDRFSSSVEAIDETIAKVHDQIEQNSISIERNTISLEIEEGKAYPDSEKVTELQSMIAEAKKDKSSLSAELSDLEADRESELTSLQTYMDELEKATSDVEAYTKSLEKTTTELFNSQRDRIEYFGHSKVYDMYLNSAQQKLSECEEILQLSEEKFEKLNVELENLKEDPKCGGAKSA